MDLDNHWIRSTILSLALTGFAAANEPAKIEVLKPKLSLSTRGQYVLGEPMEVKLQVKPSDFKKKERNAVGICICNFSRMDGILMGYEMRLQSESGKWLKKVSPSAYRHRNGRPFGGDESITLRSGEVETLVYNLAHHFLGIKTGGYKLLLVERDSNKICAQASFKVGEFKTESSMKYSGVFLVPPDLGTAGKDSFAYVNCHVHKGTVTFGDGQKAEYLRLGRGASDSRYGCTRWNRLMTAVGGPFKDVYVRIPDGGSIRHLFGDYRGQLWTHLVNDGKNMVLVFNTRTGRAITVQPWTKSKVFLTSGHHGYHHIFKAKFRSSSGRWYGTDSDLERVAVLANLKAEKAKGKP